jgi:hybrid cluster-associated redox disulfide protein
MSRMKITKNSNLLKLVQDYPHLVALLFGKYGLHCLGCMAAPFETLEQGAKAHGLTKKEIAKMVKELNRQAPLDK